MLSINAMQQHNHKIAEYSKILSVLIQDKELCHTQIVCDLFFNYVNAVNEHFTKEEKNIYQPMLIHSDSAIKNTATHFMSGSMEIKRVIAEYKKKWCSKNTLRIKNHQHFIDDTEEIFAFVCSRIIDESDRLYPAFKKATQQQKAA
ncbi:MAG: hypothetical protein KAG20_08420 [Cocleimonas sp.]|nr:hypothetical protein [Cocleimonas sp.]